MEQGQNQVAGIGSVRLNLLKVSPDSTRVRIALEQVITRDALTERAVRGQCRIVRRSGVKQPIQFVRLPQRPPMRD